MKRAKTRKIHIANIAIGGDAPITVQSMTNTDTRDIKSTVSRFTGWKRPGVTLYAAQCLIKKLLKH